MAKKSGGVLPGYKSASTEFCNPEWLGVQMGGNNVD